MYEQFTNVLRSEAIKSSEQQEFTLGVKGVFIVVKHERSIELIRVVRVIQRIHSPFG